MTDDIERPARTRSITVRLPEAAVEAIEGARRMLGCETRTEAIIALIVAGAEAIAPPDEDALLAAVRAALLADADLDAEARAELATADAGVLHGAWLATCRLGARRLEPGEAAERELHLVTSREVGHA